MVDTATAIYDVATATAAIVQMVVSSAIRGHAVLQALDRAKSALAATLEQLLRLEVKRVEQTVGCARIVTAEAPESLASKHSGLLVGVGDSLLNTGLYELDVFL